MDKSSEQMGIVRLLAYGSVSLPLATIGLPLSIYLAPFYSGALGLPLAQLGIAMMLARLVDIIVDPAIGVISDRWRPSVGRRKFWLPIGVTVMALGTWMLFMPGDGKVGIGYFFLWTTLLYLGFTATKLPYEAWGGRTSAVL
jgi:Na+/melibiose symporter-like transporter